MYIIQIVIKSYLDIEKWELNDENLRFKFTITTTTTKMYIVGYQVAFEHLIFDATSGK